MIFKERGLALIEKGWTVAKVKFFIGREGHGYNANLLKDGKKVATVIDDASGGETRFSFDNLNVEQAFYADCNSMPSSTAYGMTIPYNPDQGIGELVDLFDNIRKITRECKTKTIFTTKKTDEDGTYYRLNVAFPESKPEILKRHPDAKFLNEHPLIVNKVI